MTERGLRKKGRRFGRGIYADFLGSVAPVFAWLIGVSGWVGARYAPDFIRGTSG